MNRDTLKAATAAARAFLAAAKAVESDEASMRYLGISGTKLTGKLRRASMDLTRALADLRRPS